MSWCPRPVGVGGPLLRGRDHGRRPVAGPRRRRRRPRRALALVVLGAVRGHLQLRGQDLEHHLHVPVATGLHILVKLQYAAAAACVARADADAGGDGGPRAARRGDHLLPPPRHDSAHGRRDPRGGQPRRSLPSAPPRSRAPASASDDPPRSSSALLRCW